MVAAKGFPLMRSRIISWLIPALAFGVALFTHTYRLGYNEFQGDEATPAWLAGRIAAGSWQSIFYFNHTPGRVLALVPMFWLGWTDEVGIRAANALAGATTTLLVYWLARLLFDERRVAWFALAIFSVAGTAVLQRMAIGTGLFVFFSTLTLCGVVVYLKHGKSWGLVVFALAWLAACLTFLDGIFLGVGILLAWGSYRDWRFDRRFAGAFLSVIFSVTGFFALWLYLPYRWADGEALGVYGPLYLLKRGTAGVGGIPFRETWRVLFFYNGLGHTLVLFAGVLLGLLRFKKNRDCRVLIGFVALPLIYFSVHAAPTVHIVGFLPLLVVLSAAGWDGLWTRGGNFARAGALVLLVAVGTGMAHTWRVMLQPWALTRPAAYGWGMLWRRGYRAAGEFLAAREALTSPSPTSRVTVTGEPDIWLSYSRLAPVFYLKPAAFTTRYAWVFPELLKEREVVSGLAGYTLIARVFVAKKVTLILYEKAESVSSDTPPVRIEGGL